MLTHGKKVWGIWRISVSKFMRNYLTGSIDVYDDHDVINADILRLEPQSDYEIRVISAGEPKPYLNFVETKLGDNAKSKTAD